MICRHWFRHVRSHCVGRLLLTSSVALLVGSNAWSADPTARQALSLTPMQSQVDFDKPAAEEIDKCRIEAERTGELRAWVVTGTDGATLRRFADTNGDNKIDQWCYYRGGIEVYRDIDANFNEKADQYRWFNTGGMRWGEDTNEDGRIDQWKWISPEEVTAELVDTLRQRDAQRFQALLVTEEQLKAFGLPEPTVAMVSQQLASAVKGFSEYAAKQTLINGTSKWFDFSAPTPGVVSTTGQHASGGLVAYENVIAMIETDGKTVELPVGTLVQVGHGWRLIGLPSSDATGFFFRPADARPGAPAASETAEAAIDPKLQQLSQKLEELDKQLARVGHTGDNREIHAQRVEVLRQMVTATKGEDRDVWLMQLIDAVVATAQNSADEADLASLGTLAEEIGTVTENKDIIAQAKFAHLTAAYSASLRQPDANFAKIQEKWVEDLKGFATANPGTRPTSEAILQLAISEEFAGNEESALKWYGEIIRDYASSDLAEKATGAIRRLQSLGKPLELRGTTLTGKAWNIGEAQGYLTVVHYWATWSESCKEEMQQLKKLLSQYGRTKFAVVGVNLDDQPRAAVEYLQKEKMGWLQLHEAGGLESVQAKQMGIFTLPVMLLIDEKGKVVNRAVTMTDLETELQKRLKTSRKK